MQATVASTTRLPQGNLPGSPTRQQAGVRQVPLPFSPQPRSQGSSPGQVGSASVSPVTGVLGGSVASIGSYTSGARSPGNPLIISSSFSQFSDGGTNYSTSLGSPSRVIVSGRSSFGLVQPQVISASSPVVQKIQTVSMPISRSASGVKTIVGPVTMPLYTSAASSSIRLTSSPAAPNPPPIPATWSTSEVAARQAASSLQTAANGAKDLANAATALSGETQEVRQMQQQVDDIVNQVISRVGKEDPGTALGDLRKLSSSPQAVPKPFQPTRLVQASQPRKMAAPEPSVTPVSTFTPHSGAAEVITAAAAQREVSVAYSETAVPVVEPATVTEPPVPGLSARLAMALNNALDSGNLQTAAAALAAEKEPAAAVTQSFSNDMSASTEFSIQVSTASELTLEKVLAASEVPDSDPASPLQAVANLEATRAALEEVEKELQAEDDDEGAQDEEEDAADAEKIKSFQERVLISQKFIRTAYGIGMKQRRRSRRGSAVEAENTMEMFALLKGRVMEFITLVSSTYGNRRGSSIMKMVTRDISEDNEAKIRAEQMRKYALYAFVVFFVVFTLYKEITTVTSPYTPPPATALTAEAPDATPKRLRVVSAVMSAPVAAAALVAVGGSVVGGVLGRCGLMARSRGTRATARGVQNGGAMHEPLLLNA